MGFANVGMEPTSKAMGGELKGHPKSSDPVYGPYNGLQVNLEPKVEFEVSQDGDRITITILNPPSEDASNVLGGLLHIWVKQFMSKNADYADDDLHTADLLGSMGQFAEIWRKVGKLYLGMWKKKELKHEGIVEILYDLIGHCFLAINYYGRGK